MARHQQDTAADLAGRAYEPNVIGLRGIVGFGIGLFILIVVTFGLMWALLAVMHDQAVDEKGTPGPLTMSDVERLPPEPRLQAAPGFGVDATRGRVNLELQAPQSEYQELQKLWSEWYTKGMTDPSTGVQISMPIEQAKQRLLQQQTPVKPGTDPNIVTNSRLFVSDSSGGRLASEKYR